MGKEKWILIGKQNSLLMRGVNMDKFLVSNIDKYRRTSRRNYLKYHEVLKKIDELYGMSGKWLLGNDFNEMSHELFDQRYTHQVTAIVFQAMAVEAFINEYTYLRLGKSYFESIDKLSALDKILIGCKMITGKDFPKDRKAYYLLKTIIKLRNDLVHYKAKKIDLGDEIKTISDKEFVDVMDAYDELVKELDLLDDNFEKKYLEKVVDDFWNAHLG